MILRSLVFICFLLMKGGCPALPHPQKLCAPKVLVEKRILELGDAAHTVWHWVGSDFEQDLSCSAVLFSPQSRLEALLIMKLGSRIDFNLSEKTSDFEVAGFYLTSI